MVKRPQPSKPKLLPREVPWQDDEPDVQVPAGEPIPPPPPEPVGPQPQAGGQLTGNSQQPSSVGMQGTGQLARPPAFRAPMGDERKRYLLTHIGHISSGAHTWSEEVRELADEGLVKVSGDMLVLTDLGREELERL